MKHRIFSSIVLTTAVAMGIAGCKLSPSDYAQHNTPSTNATASDTQAQLVQFPGKQTPGDIAVSDIDKAHVSVAMEMYSLNDMAVEKALVNAKNRGVNVTVLLNSDFNGTKYNANAMAYLQKNHVKAKWAPTNRIFHIKTIVIDNKFADISTANLNHNDYTAYADAMVRTTNSQQVSAIAKTFANDYRHPRDTINDTVQAPGLIWSPDAEKNFITAIDSAKLTLEFSSEELVDKPVINALKNAAKRGVTCSIVLNDEKQYHETLHQLAQLGCSVTTVHPTTQRYVHIKQLIVDRKTIVVGSQNVTWTSMQKNRELSITLKSSSLANTMHAAFGHLSDPITYGNDEDAVRQVY